MIIDHNTNANNEGKKTMASNKQDRVMENVKNPMKTKQ